MRHDSLSRLKTDHTRVSHFGLQKLPEGILRRLGLVQSKTRYLPLHLHSRRIVLPGVKGHSDITVSCPFPKYFTNTLKRLQIPLPGKEWDGSQLAALFEKVLHLDLILTVEKVMYKADITLLCILNVFLSRLSNKRPLKVLNEEKWYLCFSCELRNDCAY